MPESMTPSEVMTSGQINKAVANYRALLEKHAGEFNTEAAQIVLGQPELSREQFLVLRRHIEAVSNLIVRTVKVNRTRSPQEALDATGRMHYTDRKVVDSMPKGEGDEVELVLFKLDLSARGGIISDDDLEKEFEMRGLKPADPYSVVALNEADPAFADEKPNGTHWKDSGGKWCFAAFDRWSGERRVNVFRYGYDWYGIWWFVGLRK